VSGKSERQLSREAVVGYHEAMLSELVRKVATAVDRYRDGELDAFEVDRVLFQYSRAAKELWKFCSMGDAGIIASHVREGLPIDWWERGAPKRR
jgi:hypothetical protein